MRFGDSFFWPMRLSEFYTKSNLLFVLNLVCSHIFVHIREEKIPDSYGKCLSMHVYYSDIFHNACLLELYLQCRNIVDIGTSILFSSC